MPCDNISLKVSERGDKCEVVGEKDGKVVGEAERRAEDAVAVVLQVRRV